MDRLNMKMYITERVKQLDELIEKQPEGSNHRYALMAGKFELLQMAVALEL